MEILVNKFKTKNMETRLTIKHIAPYLPYGVNCRYKYLSSDKYTKAKLTGVTLREVETTYKRKRKGCVGDLIGFEGNNNIHDLKFKLELRPLSDLTKEIEHNGEKFVPMVKLAKIQHPNIDFEIVNERCFGRLNTGIVIEFTIDNEIPFYKEYQNNIFGQSKSDDYDDMSLAIYKPSEIRGKFAEWHIDFQNLIEQGLAIDLNTVK